MLADAARDAGVQLRQIEAGQETPGHPSLRGVEEGLTALEKGLTAPEKAGE